MADSAATDATKGPSKKQLNKLARQNKPAGSNENNAKYSVLFCKGASPDLTRAVELHLGEAGVVKYFINKGVDAHLPLMKSLADGDAWSVSGDENVARYLVRVSTAANAASLYGSGDAVKTSQIDQWLSVYDRSMCCASVRDTLVALVNTHVAERTFFVGSELTLADIAIWTALRRQNFTPAFETAPHTSRWFEFVTSSIAPWSAIPVSVPVPPAGSDAAAAKKGAAPPKAAAATESSAAAAADADEAGALGGCPPLEGAVEGQVCTRFPPEPSGYLHIGKLSSSIGAFSHLYLLTIAPIYVTHTHTAHYRSREGGAAEPVLRAALQGPPAGALRRHEPQQGEGGVRREHSEGPRDAQSEARRGEFLEWY